MFVLFGDAEKSLSADDDDVRSLGVTLMPMDKIAVFLKEKTGPVRCCGLDDVPDYRAKHARRR